MKPKNNKKMLGFIIVSAFLIMPSIVNGISNSDIVWTYSISKMPIAGTIYHAKMLDNGNIIYAVGRAIDNSVPGVAEINPTTGETVFAWHNDSWSDATNGPETIYKYSNGNYLICDGDGGSYCYEMYPNHSLVWNYYTGRGALARPMIINGEDDVILLVKNTITIINRSDQRTVWTDSSFTYVDDADYRIINGKQILLVSDYKGHNIMLMDYKAHKVVWNYIIDATDGPYETDFYDNNNIIVAMGKPSYEIAIVNRQKSKIIWNSSKFDNNPIAEKLINSTYAMAGDGQVLKIIRIKAGKKI